MKFVIYTVSGVTTLTCAIFLYVHQGLNPRGLKLKSQDLKKKNNNKKPQKRAAGDGREEEPGMLTLIPIHPASNQLCNVS